MTYSLGIFPSSNSVFRSGNESEEVDSALEDIQRE